MKICQNFVDNLQRPRTPVSIERIRNARRAKHQKNNRYPLRWFILDYCSRHYQTVQIPPEPAPLPANRAKVNALTHVLASAQVRLLCNGFFFGVSLLCIEGRPLRLRVMNYDCWMDTHKNDGHNASRLRAGVRAYVRACLLMQAVDNCEWKYFLLFCPSLTAPTTANRLNIFCVFFCTASTRVLHSARIPKQLDVASNAHTETHTRTPAHVFRAVLPLGVKCGLSPFTLALTGNACMCARAGGSPLLHECTFPSRQFGGPVVYRICIRPCGRHFLVDFRSFASQRSRSRGLVALKKKATVKKSWTRDTMSWREGGRFFVCPCSPLWSGTSKTQHENRNV